jgi:CheY-like chemotaxis protein
MPKTAHRPPRKPARTPASTRSSRYGPPIPVATRKVWILGCEPQRVETAVTFLLKAGHQARGGEPGADVGAALRTERPDLVVIDMATQGDRGKHVAVQLRADRGTRQLPIVLVGVTSQEGPKMDRSVPGPTRRYAGALDSNSVLEAIAKDL